MSEFFSDSHKDIPIVGMMSEIYFLIHSKSLSDVGNEFRQSEHVSDFGKPLSG